MRIPASYSPKIGTASRMADNTSPAVNKFFYKPPVQVKQPPPEIPMRKISCVVYCLIIVFSCLTQVAATGAPVKLRINTKHGLANAKGAVLDAGLKLETEIIVTASSQHDGTPFLPPDKFAEDAQTVGATILSSSFSNWNFTYDSDGYEKLTKNGMVHVFAYEPRQPQPWNVPPPATFVTVNKIGGRSGGGIEFVVPSTYMHGKGQSMTPSGVTAQVAGLMACLKYSHPTWNWFDIKAAMRATASNYATGYDQAAYGYGAIDYYAANAFRDAAKLPLFAPAAVVLHQRGDQLIFAINAFKQSRRYTEALFVFPTRPLPQHKELTLEEITAMGGQLIFSNLRDANMYSCRVAGTAPPYFVWFTQDAHGLFSRIEPYSIIGPKPAVIDLPSPPPPEGAFREDHDFMRFLPERQSSSRPTASRPAAPPGSLQIGSGRSHFLPRWLSCPNLLPPRFIPPVLVCHDKLR